MLTYQLLVTISNISFVLWIWKCDQIKYFIISFGDHKATLGKKFSAKSEIVAYHKVKRIFLPLGEIEKEDPNHIEIYEFKGEDFNLVASWFYHVTRSKDNLNNIHIDPVILI